FFFFFSSRRRHTRSYGDWSSDVCSSDLHLINQRRYQTIRWAAMIFLLAANRMSRGYAKLRQWLILLFRTAAIAGLIFAISRPLRSEERRVGKECRCRWSAQG